MNNICSRQYLQLYFLNSWTIVPIGKMMNQTTLSYQSFNRNRTYLDDISSVNSFIDKSNSRCFCFYHGMKTVAGVFSHTI